MLVQPYAPDPGVSPLGGIWRRGDFVFLHGVWAIVARFLRNLRRISDGRRDAARSDRPDGSRAAYHLRHPHYQHPVLR